MDMDEVLGFIVQIQILLIAFVLYKLDNSINDLYKHFTQHLE